MVLQNCRPAVQKSLRPPGRATCELCSVAPLSRGVGLEAVTADAGGLPEAESEMGHWLYHFGESRRDTGDSRITPIRTRHGMSRRTMQLFS